MANACTIFSYFPTEGNDPSKIKDIISNYDDYNFKETDGSYIVSIEIFSCRPDDMTAYIEQFRSFKHHTFIGDTNFTGRTLYFQSSTQREDVRGFIEDDVESTIGNFTQLIEECPQDVAKSIFYGFLAEELEMHKENLESDPDDEWSAEQIAIFEALLAVIS